MRPSASRREDRCGKRRRQKGKSPLWLGSSLLSASSEPEILNSGSSLHIQEGESLRLVCAAESNPRAVLSWEQLTQKHIQLSNEELQLPSVELEDQGKYICRAANSLGVQVASVSLLVRSELEDDGGGALQSQLGKPL